MFATSSGGYSKHIALCEIVSIDPALLKMSTINDSPNN